ncbi:MAG: methyltransferase domain-containing protein [Bacteroidota bacterium]
MTEQQYWTARYAENRTGWDIGYPSTPIKEYIDQLTDRNQRILIPGAGNAYEAEYLHQQGFSRVFVLDISPAPLAALSRRVPSFPKNRLINENFFEHEGEYDLIFEQTFFCSFMPTKENRSAYAKKMSELLHPGGKLVGLWFNFPLNPEGNRPFGGSRSEYLSYLEPYLAVKTFEPSYNSIPPRQGKELFGIFERLHDNQ